MLDAVLKHRYIRCRARNGAQPVRSAHRLVGFHRYDDPIEHTTDGCGLSHRGGPEKPIVPVDADHAFAEWPPGTHDDLVPRSFKSRSNGATDRSRTDYRYTSHHREVSQAIDRPRHH